MGSFDHPAPRLETRLPLDGLGLFTPRPNMSRVLEFLGQFPDFVIVIALSRQRCCGRSGVGSGRGITSPSRVTRANFMSWRLAPSMTTLNGRPEASVNRLRFVPCLPRSVGFRPVFLSPPTGPWSWPHPSTTMTSPIPSRHHGPADPRAKKLGTPRPPSIRRTADGPSYWSKSRSRSRRSIGIPYAARTRSHSWPYDRARAGYGNPTDAVSAAGAEVPSCPRGYPEYAIHHPS